jgi:hypothetical protein
MERTALKEWAVIVDALARGDICALIRKGGLREHRAGFSVRHDQFLFYPTFFHENPDELAPALRPRLSASNVRPPQGRIFISLMARVAHVWRVTDLQKLHAIDGMHGLAWQAVESRFNYRNNPVVHVVAVEMFGLPDPVSLPDLRRYQGCVSWVELDIGLDISEARHLHPKARITERIAQLRAALGEPEAADAV